MDNPAVTANADQRIRTSEAQQSNGAGDTPTEPQAGSTLHDTNGRSSNVNKRVGSSKDEHGWRRIVRNFSPSWFSVTMGTGIVANIFYIIPWKADWLHYLSI
ncbi:hypothetical protein KC352_g36467, partial [Hortaea werneckii]